MPDLLLIWEEVLRFTRTHQVEAKDVIIACAIGFVALLLIALATWRRSELGSGRDRWVLVALDSDGRADDIIDAFRRKEWDVQPLPPDASLAEFLRGFNPSLLVVDQTKYGNELTRLESTDSKVASTPILYLHAKQVDRTAVPMRAWLPGNAKMKTILERADKLVRGRPSAQQLSRNPQVKGALSQGTLLELLYFQANTQRTGRMEISYGGLSGWLWIKKGDIRHAVVGGIEGTEALNAMLDLVDGRFSFVASVEPPTTTITVPTVFLLHEYARKRDELGKMAGN
jgi:hypothetical protein